MNSLVRITEASEQLGVSSRTMRYYEEIGLIMSIRPQFEAYRYYDEMNLERVRQICILRKMQIPIKDIKHIFETQDIKVVVETFLKSIEEIDMKITSLGELRAITNEFIKAMLDSGISHIDALPIVYDKIQSTMVKDQEEIGVEKETLSYDKLHHLSNTMQDNLDPDVMMLSAMRMWSSVRKNTGKSDTDGFYEWLDMFDIYPAKSQQHLFFEYQSKEGDTVILAKKTREIEEIPFMEEDFEGGLFAAGSVYVDDDIHNYTLRLMESIHTSPYYEIEYGENGDLRTPILAEEIHSLDCQREKIMLYIPIKRRHRDASFYGNYQRVSMDEKTLESKSPILWKKQIDLSALISVNDPYFYVNEQGEAEYIPCIDIRRLSTNTEVSLPFRIDVEFKIEPQKEQFLYGSDEGSLRIYYGSNLLGMNMGNNSESALSEHAIEFQQPVFGDTYYFPNLGAMELNQYHQLSWIVGKNELAVIIDHEVRLCGINFPYMKIDFHEETPHNISLGSNGQSKVIFRSVTVSQLKSSVKNILKGDFQMNTKRSNNIIPTIHPLITKNLGENYWFNGAAKYVMESKGETKFDYEFWAGVSGDIFTQMFSKNDFLGDGCSEYFLYLDQDKSWVEDTFEKAGYTATFVLFSDLRKNKEMYLNTLMAYIDQGVPVIWKRNDYTVWNVIVGYEENGKTLLYLTDEQTEPMKVSSEEAMDYCQGLPKTGAGWIFIGGKCKDVNVSKVYREAILSIPTLFAKETELYCAGGKAFRTWAEMIESGKFDHMKPEEYDDWAMHKSYVCAAATNSSCCYTFLSRALEDNPDLKCIETITEYYKGMKTLWDELEKLGGGFGISLEILKDHEKALAIANKIREFAEYADKIAIAVEQNQ